MLVVEREYLIDNVNWNKKSPHKNLEHKDKWMSEIIKCHLVKIPVLNEHSASWSHTSFKH
jgi:hypothetical protein